MSRLERGEGSVEPLSVVALASLVLARMLPAIHDLGERVLDASEDRASSATVNLGVRTLQKLLGRTDDTVPVHSDYAVLAAAVRRRVLELARSPDDEKSAARLEGAVEELLRHDPRRASALRDLLADTQPAPHLQNIRSVDVRGDNRGVAVAGDGNRIDVRGGDGSTLG